ncbi:PH-domain-containing protein [Athelia psychrophila]|uniref:PH-domain-containing protein n=1 Tax=Athelia psychrophila TaxID=1759441 RepID=A0A166UL33_9AGAM|nr:PH-domain-containing protein [Fibularhizoctonia sp. CBS 109695]
MSTTRAVPPPSPQEVQRKLSLHNKPKPTPSPGPPTVSGTESESDPILSPPIDILPNTTSLSSNGGSVGLLAGTSPNPPLSSIIERRSGSGDESDEEDDGEEVGGWRPADAQGKPQASSDETVIKAGYLSKKGERRKTWKKRWFVLRPAHLAYYKTDAEYQLLKILDLSEIHSCTPISLKKHANTFGLVSPVRTFYLQANTPGEVQSWVKAIQEARETLLATSTTTSLITPPTPIPIPNARNRAGSHPPPPITPSPASRGSLMQNMTSSDSEDGSPTIAGRTYSSSSQNRPAPMLVASPSPVKALGTAKDPSKAVLSGYLMKCGSKRHNWRKRWFVLNSERLLYSGSHMDTKPHREFKFSEILDALEYDLPSRHQSPSSAASPPYPASSADSEAVDRGSNTFKIVTTKRTLLLCAPSEEEEIKWLSAICALVARRKDLGVVPGESSEVVAHAHHPHQHSHQQLGHPHQAPGVGAKGKSRTMSMGGSVAEEE